ncbi:MAG TPA: SIMPL domain-containing protein [Candidatus Pristimantibacillus sp.]|nr:SIMPL domain-containing protein [Candidatus Pristimantibacillus sp.]
MSNEPAPKAQKLSVSIDYRFITVGLLAVIAAMLFIWKPWQPARTGDRTVQVTGQSTIKARPDEFAFYPSYDFTNIDKGTALGELTTRSGQIVAGLKQLGVADKDIKTNSDSWSYPTIMPEGGSKGSVYTLRLTVTTHDDSLTQKVQDYLVSTGPTGSISPQATFSDAKLKQLQDQGRDAAGQDARKKADQSAKNLGFKLAGVKTVDDGVGFGGIYPLNGKTAMPMDATMAGNPSLAVQPGENELNYTVTVTYFIR